MFQAMLIPADFLVASAHYLVIHISPSIVLSVIRFRTHSILTVCNIPGHQVVKILSHKLLCLYSLLGSPLPGVLQVRIRSALLNSLPFFPVPVREALSSTLTRPLGIHSDLVAPSLRLLLVQSRRGP